MYKESREVCTWFLERRKVEDECIVLGDIFELNRVDVRVRKLVTHRAGVFGPKGNVHYRVVALATGRVVPGKLGVDSILTVIKTSGEPLTLEELEKEPGEASNVD